MNPIRIVLILLFGGLLTSLTYLSRFHTYYFDNEIWSVAILFCIILLIWSMFSDVKNYRVSKRVLSLSPTVLAWFFIIPNTVMHFDIKNDLNKTSLLRVFCNGDYNGAGIDFKTDGTYIFNNSSIGISSNKFGTYLISGDRIILDKKRLNNVVLTNTLEIRNKEVEDAEGNRVEKYLYQVSDDGQAISNATEFQVIVDNRGD